MPLVAHKLVVLDLGRQIWLDFELAQVGMNDRLVGNRQKSLECGQLELAAGVEMAFEFLLNVVSSDELAQIRVVQHRAESGLEFRNRQIKSPLRLKVR